MRIVAGRLKGRILTAPEGRDVRPTSDRARQSVFNVLEHAAWAPDLEGARALDAFCGTGALAFEALSRGAAHATLMDQNQTALAAARENATSLQVLDAVALLRADATRPPRAGKPVDLAFLDPPYGKDLAASALAALDAAGWFAPEATIVVETSPRDELILPHGFELLDERRYGAARISFLRRLTEA